MLSTAFILLNSCILSNTNIPDTKGHLPICNLHLEVYSYLNCDGKFLIVMHL